MMKPSPHSFDPWIAHSFFESGVSVMLAVVYAVRSPLRTLIHALLSENTSAVVFFLEDPLLPGNVFDTGNIHE